MDLYQILSLAASFLAAVGTIAATIVALYLSSRQDKVRLKVSVYKAVMIGGGQPWPEHIAISIVNRSKFPVQIDSVGWAFPKSRCGLCTLIDPRHLLSNGVIGARFPFSINPGEKAPLFTIPWSDFKSALNHLVKNDNSGEYTKEMAKKRVCFYVSTPRMDENMHFQMSKDVMDAFVECAK
ncbi:MAG: hypothetical protein MJZ76_02570 [Bacteroidales bacterium]|nr:hypothetical protein [Bacteroidales bacterium]